MTLKKRLALTITLMLCVPALLIALLSATLMAGMALQDRLALSETLADMAAGAGSSAITPDDKLFGWFALWAGVSLAIIITSVVIGIVYISRRLLIPMRELTRAAERIRDGELEFEVMSSNDAEAKELCDAFDDMRRRLRDSVAERLEMERQRNLMLAHISHDLRTPVTSIKGYVEGIRDGVAVTPEMLVRYLDTIHVKADSMERMIEQMSDFSELELGRMRFDLAPLDLAVFADSVKAEFGTDFVAEGATLDLRHDGAEGRPILADEEKLRRVFQNLLSNCIKYRDDTRPLKVAVTVSYVQPALLVVIADNGKGIDNKDVGRVFDGFFRGDISRSGPAGGHGLGLTISRQIVSRLGGKMWIQSQVGVGTEVYMQFQQIDKEKD